MATRSSILAWRIPWTEEPGGLQFKRNFKGNKLICLKSFLLVNFLLQITETATKYNLAVDFKNSTRGQHVPRFLSLVSKGGK